MHSLQCPTADAPAFLPAENEILTGDVRLASAVAVAKNAMRRGRLVQVCAYCATDAMRTVMEDLPNVSHGICGPCMAVQLAEMKR